MVTAQDIMITLVAALLLGTASELHELGTSAQSQTLDFSRDMVSAIDCAYTAQPLHKCAPRLMTHQTGVLDTKNELISLLDDIEADQIHAQP